MERRAANLCGRCRARQVPERSTQGSGTTEEGTEVPQVDREERATMGRNA